MTTPARAVVALGDALERLALDPALRRRLGAAGRQYVLDEGLWDHRVARMLTIYEDVLATGGARDVPARPRPIVTA
jgi:glycosyltransferase involved in cell wall biosynthesis